MNTLIKFIISIALPLVAGFIGSFFTFDAIPTWYAALAKSSLNPPSYIFGPVWTTLYILMGIAFFLIWQKGALGREVVIVFLIQLVLNALWSIVFFGLKNPAGALIVIALLWLSIVWNIVVFWQQSRTSGILLLPYLAWVSFASYLNYAVWMLNK